MNAESPLDKSSLAERAALRLKRAIVAGEYPPGARLPSEKALAEQLGVTRLTVREALSRLSTLGFVETRHGSGTRVRSLEDEPRLEMLVEMLKAGRELDASEIASLMEFRTRVMLAFADTIVAGAQVEHLDALGRVLDEAASAKSPSARAELDHRFDSILARASGNRFLALLLGSLHDLFVRLGASVHRAHADDEDILATQRTLVAALRKRSASRARRVLQTYLEGAARALEHDARPRGGP